MIVYVNDKTSKIKIKDGLYELRGNFAQETTEDGVTYKCNAYRTKSNTATFDELYNAERLTELKEYLNSTDWIYAKCAEEDVKASDVYPEVVAKRKQTREEINTLE